jgi:hypothetical protein
MLSFYEMTSRVARLLFTCYGESNSLHGRIGIFTLNEAQAHFLYGLDAIDRDRPGEPSFRYPPLPTEAYRGPLMPSVISVSVWLPISSVLSASYCLDRYCELKWFAIPR